MARKSVICYLIAQFGLAGALCCLPALARATAGENNLTLEEVVNLTRAKFSEDVIITKIKKNAKPFDLSTEELLDLKKEGVGDDVIKYLIDPSLPYAPPPPSPAPSDKPGEPAKKYPKDPYATRVPPEPGLYVFPANTLAKVELKFLLGSEEAKTLMKKGKTLAYLIGPTSETHVNVPTPVFYFRLPEAKESEELVLVSLTQKNGRRQIDFGPKQEIKAEDTRWRDLLEVGPRLYRLTTAKLAPGEYLFFFIGSAEPSKGVFGKGYDFTIQSEDPAKHHLLPPQ